MGLSEGQSFSLGKPITLTKGQHNRCVKIRMIDTKFQAFKFYMSTIDGF